MTPADSLPLDSFLEPPPLAPLPPCVDLARGPGTAVVWLNRPEQGNALDAQTISELRRVVAAQLADPAVRVVVLAGRGDAFCRGFDLDTLAAASAADLHPAAELLAAIEHAAKPVVARVHGTCAGFGMALAAAATVVVAARDACFSQTGVLHGIVPNLATSCIAAAIGTRAAQRWLLTGEALDAAEAWRLGLAHELCEADQLDARVNQILGQFIHAAPNATQATLALLRSLSAASPAQQASDLAANLQNPEVTAALAARRTEQAPPWVEVVLKEMPEAKMPDDAVANEA